MAATTTYSPIGCKLSFIPFKYKMNSWIELNPEICGGRPVVQGTRITVETILTYLSAGDSIEDILGGHPRLTREGILACLDYARRLASTHSTVRMAS